MALADEPIAGGRHKVFGHPGPGASSRRRRRSPRTCRGRSGWPSRCTARTGWESTASGREDAVVVCSFGDASANHSTAAGAINTAINTALSAACRCRSCSSARTTVWASRCRRRRAGSSPRTGRAPGCDYLVADGADPATAWPVIMEAVHRVRERPPPGLPAPADGPVPRPRRQRRRDQLPHAARGRGRLRPGSLAGHGSGLAGPAERPDEILAPLRRRSAPRSTPRSTRCIGEPRSAPATEVMAPLAPRQPDEVGASAADAARPPLSDQPRTLAESINATLGELLTARPRVIVFGEDVGVKGGVYGVTARPGPPVRRGPGLRHRARRAVDPRSGAGRRSGRSDPDPGDPVPGLPAQRRRSTSRRGGHAAVLLPGPLHATRWSSGSPDSRTRRDSAATSTTTTRSACCATSPDWSSPARPAPTTPRRCCAPASPPRSPTATVSVFLEPIALYHRRDLPSRATAAGSQSTMASHVPIGPALGAAARAEGRRPDHDHVRQRGADVPAGGRRLGAAGHRGRGARPALAGPAAGRGRARAPASDRAGAGRRRDRGMPAGSARA